MDQLHTLKSYLENLPLDADQQRHLSVLFSELEAQLLTNQANMMESKRKYHFLKSALNELPNPIFMKNQQGEFVYFNAQYEQYFNMDRATYLNKTVLDLDYLPMDERIRYQNEDLHLISTKGTSHYEATFQLPNGQDAHSLYWSKGFEASPTGERGLVGEIVDISIQKKLQEDIKASVDNLEVANQQIEVLLKQDCLTGLFNRRAIEELIQKEAQRNDGTTLALSMIMADLDHFKRVNDTYGHSAGDYTLVEFSKILQACCRQSDLLIRFGGEEFLVILYRATPQVAENIAERIRVRTEQVLQLPDNSHVTVSMGVSTLRPQENLESCINRADAALYQAKLSGRNRIETAQ
ncbi:MAG: GGDEF domain-containing protein [Eubacteriales bacterium]